MQDSWNYLIVLFMKIRSVFGVPFTWGVTLGSQPRSQRRCGRLLNTPLPSMKETFHQLTVGEVSLFLQPKNPRCLIFSRSRVDGRGSLTTLPFYNPNVHGLLFYFCSRLSLSGPSHSVICSFQGFLFADGRKYVTGTLIS